MHKASQEETYRAIAEQFGAPLRRLARGYEADSDKRRDLLQEIHVALWRSLDGYEAKRSLRTWVYIPSRMPARPFSLPHKDVKNLLTIIY